MAAAGLSRSKTRSSPLFDTRLSVPSSSCDEEFPKFIKSKKQLRKSASDRRMPRMLPPSSASLESSVLCKDNLWSTENREYLEMRFGVIMIPACKKNLERVAGESKRFHSPSSSSDASIFSNNPDSASCSSLGSSFVRGDESSRTEHSENKFESAAATTTTTEYSENKFIDFNLEGGNLVYEDDESSSSSSSSSSAEDEIFAKNTQNVLPEIQKCWSSGRNWRFLGSYKDQNVKFVSRFAASPTRFFAPKIRRTAPPPAEIHCRPTSRKKFTSFFRRKSVVVSPAIVQNEECKEEIRHAHLHCSVRRDHHSYTFVVDGCDELLVARTPSSSTTSKDFSSSIPENSSGICEFFSWKQKQKRGRRRKWRSKEISGSQKQSELVASMKLTRRRFGIRELEFVLLGSKNRDFSSCNSSDAAVPPRSSFSSWDASQNNSDDEDILRQVWEHLESAHDEERMKCEEELAAFIVTVGSPSSDDQKNKNMNVKNMVGIFPAARHEIPENAAAPCPLIQRWRSGGCCDCGSWDLGCHLNVLHHEQQEDADELSLRIALQGPGKQRDAVEIIALRNELFSVKFKTPMVTPLQAFAAAVATLYSGGTCAAPFLRRNFKSLHSRVAVSNYGLALAPWSKALRLPYSSSHLERL